MSSDLALKGVATEHLQVTSERMSLTHQIRAPCFLDLLFLPLPGPRPSWCPHDNRPLEHLAHGLLRRPCQCLAAPKHRLEQRGFGSLVRHGGLSAVRRAHRSHGAGGAGGRRRVASKEDALQLDPGEVMKRGPSTLHPFSGELFFPLIKNRWIS